MALGKGENIIRRRITSYAIRGGLGALAFLLAFIPAFAALLVWQVRQGPVSVAPALPYAADFVRERTGIAVSAANALLVWDDDRRRLVFRLSQVAIGNEGGMTVRLPLVDLSYTLPGLARGVLLPTAVAVQRPKLVLARDTEGHFRIGIGADDAPADAPQPETAGFDLRAALAPLMAPGDDHLDSIAVVDAEATVIDLPRDRRYGVPRLNARLDRTAGGLTASTDLAAAIGGVTAMFALDASYDEAEGELRATLDFQEVVPSLFAREFQALEAVSGVAVPLSGRITARLDPRDATAVNLGDLLRADAEVEIFGGQGVVLAPAPVGLAYPVHAFRIKGGYDGAAGRASLDSLLLELPEATIAADAEAAWPVEGAPPGAEGVTVRAAARLTDTAIDSFERYWPPGMVSDARAWVVQNLRDGRVEEARFSAELTGADWAGIDVSRFSGEARVKGASVHYLRPMPPITDIDGRVLFGLKEVEVLPDTGHVGDLVIQPGGRVVLSGLADETQYASIEADINGPVRDGLKLVDREPLKLLSALGTVDPNGISGKGATHLSMHFPLLNDLRLADMTVKATSKITEGVVKDAIPGRSLSEGVLDLAVDLDGLAIKGAGKVNGVPMTLGWEEKFSGPGVRTKYTIAGTVDDAGRAALGLDFMPFQKPYVTGPMLADAVATVDAKGQMILDAKLDLAAATMTVPGFGWRKDPGEPATGSATIRFLKGRMQEIQKFEASGPRGLAATGSAKAAPSGGGLANLTLADLRFGDSALTGGMSFPADGSIDASFTSDFLDLAPLVDEGGWHELTDDTEEEKAAAETARAKGQKPPPPEPATPMSLHVTAKRAKLSDDGTMTDLSATLRRGADGKWIGTVNGDLPQGHTVAVVQRQGAARIIDLASADAGAFLRATGTTRTVHGGAMKLNALLPDEGALSGKLRIDNFSVTDAPLLAHLVSVASLTGIADLLRGQGVSFWYLDAPFSKEGTTLSLADARAAGSSFGITTAGTVDTETDALGLKGTIVPFNIVNQVITNIPVLGQILGGKDSGLFAMNYSIKGTLGEPDVSVNPLSALVPGGVQKLFSLPDTPQKQTAPPEGATP